MMRVATSALYRGIQQNILRLFSDLNKAQERVATGKNFNRPSDDPLAMVNSLGLSNALARIEQYQKNMDTAKGWLDMNATVLQQASGLAARGQEIALHLLGEDQRPEVRNAAISQIDGLLGQAIGLGNTQLNGKYIYAGYETATAPFAHSTSGGTETVDYQGDENDLQIQISPDQTLTAGKNGQAVFMDSNLFTSLIALKEAIANNDQTAIQQESTNLQQAMDYFNGQVSDVGIRQDQLKTQGEIFTQTRQDLQNQLGNLENVDYNQAILEVQQKQTAYNIALSTAAQISKLSLLDYL